MNNVLDPWDLVELGFIWDMVPPDLRSQLRNLKSLFSRDCSPNPLPKASGLGNLTRLTLDFDLRERGSWVGAMKICLGSLTLGRTRVNMRLWPQRERELGGCDEPCRCHPHLLKGRSSVALHYVVMWLHYITALFCITLNIETVACFVHCQLWLVQKKIPHCCSAHVHIHWNFTLSALCAVICPVVCQESKLLCAVHTGCF